MNLAAYDNIKEFIPKKDYIQVSYKRLLSSTIEYHDKYCVLKRYDINSNTQYYYVAVFDNKQEGIKHKFLKKDKNGYVKVYLTDIWNDIPEYVKTFDNNISVELVESQIDGKVYKLIF